MPSVGVFALQGDVREHLATLTALGADAIPVRRPEELARCDGLVLPGGESTTMRRLIDAYGLREPIAALARRGAPMLGTCAGMILLADRILDGASGQETIGGIDMTVRRNAFGRQVDSFEADLDLKGLDRPVHAVFIRAPWVEQVGAEVEVLAEAEGHPVAVRQGHLMATSFHPEVADDGRIHRLFLDLVG